MHGSHEPRTYVIKLKEQLDQNWSAWFEGMSISYKGDATILKGEITDSSSLHGILTRLHDLNLTILSLECLEGGDDD